MVECSDVEEVDVLMCFSVVDCILLAASIFGTDVEDLAKFGEGADVVSVLVL